MKYTIYVDAAKGNDSNNGRKSAPFLSAQRAFDAARELLATEMTAHVTVQFKKGVYPITQAQIFDGRAIYADHYSLELRGERGAVLTGCHEIPASSFRPVTGKPYYAYRLPAELRDRNGVAPVSAAVCFNGEMREAAASEYSETPYNEECFTDENGKEYYSVFVKEDLLSGLFGAPRESDGKPSLLCDPSMRLSVVLSWYFSVVRIEGVDYAHSFGTQDEGCHKGYVALRLADPDGEQFHQNPHYVGKLGDGKGRRFRLQGNLGFLRKAGQYYYDRTEGVIYYYPKKSDDMKDGSIGLSVTSTLLSFERMRNITVEGLRLCGTTSELGATQGCLSGQSGYLCHGEKKWCLDSAIRATTVEDLTVRDCRISDVYYHGIAMNGKLRRITVDGCEFRNVGASSIAIVPEGVESCAEDLKIVNNYSQNSGCIFHNCCAFLITHVNRLSMLRNTVIDSSYSAISVGWLWNFSYEDPDSPRANVKNAEIAYNYIENPMIRCYDGGAIYINGGSLHPDKYKGSINSMHHNYAYCGTPHTSREKCMETSTSLYHDEGASHWHTHDNVIWADEETLTRWSYLSLQDAGVGVRHVTVESNYILNVKEALLTTGEGRVMADRHIYERNSVILHSGRTPSDFSAVPDPMAERITAIIAGAGAPLRKNGASVDLSAYTQRAVGGESHPYLLTGYSDEVVDRVYMQFDYNERWFRFTHAELRRIGGKLPEEFTDFEQLLFCEGYKNKAKIAFSSINTTVGLAEFGLYDQKPKLQNAMRFAKMIGCDNVRVYAGLVPEGDDTALYYESAKKRLAEFTALAEREGLTLWLCHKRGTAAKTPAEARRLLDAVASPHLRAVYSPAEAARAGVDVIEGFESLRPYLDYFAVTDLDEKGMSVPVGAGTLPYEQMLFDLLSSDYRGFIGLEPAFGLLGGLREIEANGKKYSLAGGNANRVNAAHLALRDLLSKIEGRLMQSSVN